MIAFACGCFVVTCSWFDFNAIIVLHTHLFEVMFEFAPTLIVKGKIEVAGKVPTRCYGINPGWM
jgi:hypothetical protein